MCSRAAVGLTETVAMAALPGSRAVPPALPAQVAQPAPRAVAQLDRAVPLARGRQAPASRGPAQRAPQPAAATGEAAGRRDPAEAARATRAAPVARRTIRARRQPT